MQNDALSKSDFQSIKNFDALSKGVPNQSTELYLEYGMLEEYRNEFPKLSFQALEEPSSPTVRVPVKISYK